MEFVSPSRTMQIAIAGAVNAAFKIFLEPPTIAIEPCYPKYGAHYTSAIALSLSHRLGMGAERIAELIAHTCSSTVATNLELRMEWQIEWQIRALDKGWLNICLSEEYLFKNLLALDLLAPECWGIYHCDGLWQKCRVSTVDKAPEPILQYAYARCCALIRLASRENLFPPQTERFDRLEPIEISLLMQNLAIADYLLQDENILTLDKQDKSKLRYKLSRSLAVAFLQFYDHCRIFGVTERVAFRRLLLIKITQKSLIAIAPSEINYAMFLGMDA